MATSASHAGASIRLKHDLLDPGLARIDFVTLGSSRPEFGIDHERVAAAARQHGYVHANLSMPGVHWMSIGILTEWLHQHHPEIRGGIIALSVQDLGWPGNGHYELGIVQPFRQALGSRTGSKPMFRSIGQLIETWGSRFALFAWRDDVRDFLAHPFSRLNRLRNGSSRRIRIACFRIRICRATCAPGACNHSMPAKGSMQTSMPRKTFATNAERSLQPSRIDLISRRWRGSLRSPISCNRLAISFNTSCAG